MIKRVEIVVTAATDEANKKLDAVQARRDAIGKPLSFDVGADITAALAKLEELKAAARGETGEIPITLTAELNKASLAKAEQAARVFVAASDGVTLPVYADMSKVSFERVRATADLLAKSPIQQRVNFDANNASLATTIAKEKALADSINTVSAATNRGNRFWGITNQTWHLLFSIALETLAVAIPAAIALGAGAMVAAQGAQNLYVHMSSLYDATESTYNMFGKTVGSALGLKDALQQAQNAANPEVYQIFGSGLLIVKEDMDHLAGTGLQVVGVFRDFAAKLAYDFSPHGGMAGVTNSITHAMVPDLIGLGQVFGNLGHAVASFAGDMPGLAEVLLHIAAGVTGAAVKFASSGLGKYVLLFGMGAHEAYVWGGLLARTLGRLATLGGRGALAISKVAEAFGAGGLEQGAAGAALGFSKVAKVLTGPWAWAIVTAGIVLGVLVDKMLTAQTGAQRLAEALQSDTLKASNFDVYGEIVKNIQDLGMSEANAVDVIKNFNAHVQQQEQLAKQTMQRTHEVAEGNVVYGTSVRRAQQAIQTYTAAQKQQMTDMRNVSQGVIYLSEKYGVNYVGALALAQAAGVHLAAGITGQSKAAAILRFQIASLVAGYQGMGTPMGAVGKDMDALSIDAMEQNSKVQQLNQGWDAFMSNLTGGTSNLSQFNQGLTNLTQGTNRIKTILGSSGSVTLSVQGFAKSLQSFTGKGAQAWQNFDSIVSGSAQQTIDWLRTAGSEGELSGSKFTQAVRDMVGEMLPFAKDSHTAAAELSGLAQEAGGPSTNNFSTLKTWVDKGHMSIAGLGDIIGTTTQKMSNMSQVAQNLGATVQQDIINQMSQAKLEVDNVGKATLAYTQALQSNGTQSQTTHQDYAKLVDVLTSVTGNNKLANQIAQTYARSMGDDTEKAVKYKTAIQQLGEAEKNDIKSRILTIKMTGLASWHLVGANGVAPMLDKGTVGGHAKGWRVPGYGGGDRHLALLEGGETVVPKELTPRVAGLMRRHGVPGFSDGIVGAFSGSIGGEESWMKSDYNTSIYSFESALAKSMKSGASGILSGMTGSVSGNVAGWITQALRIAHAPMAWLGILERLVSLESGGNPRAVDPISVGGQHAEGLFQTLGSTFAAYGLGGSIFNPIADAVAGIRYIMSRYGTPFAIPGLLSGAYHGYANGGWVNEPVFGMGLHSGHAYSFGEHGSEYVSPHGGGGDTNIYVTVAGDTNPDAAAVRIVKIINTYAHHHGGRTGMVGTVNPNGNVVKR